MKRYAADYLSIGDVVVVPDSIPAPILYTEDHPNGEVVRVGTVVEKRRDLIMVRFGPDKTWDYSNREAMQFGRR